MGLDPQVREGIGAHEGSRKALGRVTSEFVFRANDYYLSLIDWDDPDDPPPGSVFHYLVQSNVPHTGSLGRNSAGQERTTICGTENDCDNGIDDDGDGLTDCDDLPDCYRKGPCDAAILQYVDTTGDDVETDAMESYFSSFPVTPADYLGLSIEFPSRGSFATCVERADFYRDSYLALAASSGTVVSGAWRKWYRVDGGAWIGPTTDGFENWYGALCTGPYSWCSEYDLGGHVIGVDPGQLRICEGFDYITCEDGALLTLSVAPDRLSACGF